MAELLLNHARANDCQDVPQFKKEMAQLVDNALSKSLSLGKVLTWNCKYLSVILIPMHTVYGVGWFCVGE